MLLFPEGTCSNGESLLPFSKGAFVPGKPVRPLVLHYGGWWTPANVRARRKRGGRGGRAQNHSVRAEAARRTTQSTW